MGALPPQAAGRGGSAPTTRAMPGCCTKSDYDSFHEYRQLQSILYLTCSSFLHCYNQETLVYLSQVQTLVSLMQKWVWFLRNVGVVQNFSRATRTINILCPHNVQHLPTPLSGSYTVLFLVVSSTIGVLLVTESGVTNHHGRQIVPYLPNKTFSAKSTQFKSLKAYKEPYDASLWTCK